MTALVEGFNVFVNKFITFCNTIVAVLNYIWSILKTLWFWLTSLLTGVWDLISQLFAWQLFDYLWSWFVQLSQYIWTPAVIFISSLLLLVFLRIWIGFVFKLFRLNMNYKVFTKK